MFVILPIHKLSVFDYQLLTGHICLSRLSVTRDYNAGLEVSPGIDHPLPSVVLPGNTILPPEGEMSLSLHSSPSPHQMEALTSASTRNGQGVLLEPLFSVFTMV